MVDNQYVAAKTFGVRAMKGKIATLICTVLTLAIALTLCIPVQAESDVGLSEINESTTYDTLEAFEAYVNGLYVVKNGQQEFLMDRINSAAVEMKPWVTLEDFEISEDVHDQLQRYLWTYYVNHPEFDIRYKGAYIHDQSEMEVHSGNIWCVSFTYLGETLEEHEDIMYVTNEGVKGLAEEIAEYPQGIEQILETHNLMIELFNYDYDYGKYCSTPYGMLTTGKGTCCGYTGMFNAIMTKLGYKANVAVDEDGSHMWSLVKLNGQWYNIDVTWDEYNTGNGGDEKAQHSNFMVPDDAIGEDHGPFVTWGGDAIHAEDTEFMDGYIWNYESNYGKRMEKNDSGEWVVDTWNGCRVYTGISLDTLAHDFTKQIERYYNFVGGRSKPFSKENTIDKYRVR